mgnify:CR=1 FL=1
MKIDLSIIIPLYNETESLEELSTWIDKVVQESKLKYEIVFIDDGSTDNSWATINLLQKNNNNIKGLSFRRNYGKSAALNMGFNMSKGEQLRDYLPVEKVAEVIVNLALTKCENGIVNCCSGDPVSIQSLVEKYLQQAGVEMTLNLGHYPYPDYEPFAFWGSTKKMNEILHNGNNLI